MGFNSGFKGLKFLEIQLDRTIDTDINVNLDLEGPNCSTNGQNLSRVSKGHTDIINATWCITKCNNTGNVRIR